MLTTTGQRDHVVQRRVRLAADPLTTARTVNYFSVVGRLAFDPADITSRAIVFHQLGPREGRIHASRTGDQRPPAGNCGGFKLAPASVAPILVIVVLAKTFPKRPPVTVHPDACTPDEGKPDARIPVRLEAAVMLVAHAP